MKISLSTVGYCADIFEQNTEENGVTKTNRDKAGEKSLWKAIRIMFLTDINWCHELKGRKKRACVVGQTVKASDFSARKPESQESAR